MKLLLFVILTSSIFYSCKDSNDNSYKTKIKKEKYYLDEDRFKNIESKDLKTLRFLRNELFARHGQAFKSKDLQEYFRSKSWYREKVGHNVIYDELTDSEKKYLHKIQELEKKIIDNLRILHKDDDFYLLLSQKYKIIDNYCISLVKLITKDIGDSGEPYTIDYYYLISLPATDIELVSVDTLNIDNINKKILSKISIEAAVDEANINFLEDVSDRFNLSVNGKTLVYLDPWYNDYMINIFLELDKNGKLNLLFDYETRGKIIFKSKNDSIYVANYSSRDDLVHDFQHDYILEYNKFTKSLKSIRPDVQDFDFSTIVLKPITVYKSINGAKAKDVKDVSLKLSPNDNIVLDTVYWKENVVLISIDYKSTGYVNIDDIANGGVMINAAG